MASSATNADFVAVNSFPTKEKGMSSDKKKFVLCLYISGLSFRAIAKIVNVHHSAVHRFIKKYAQDNYEKPEPCEDAVIKLELDEMWHYIQNKKTNSMYRQEGRPPQAAFAKQKY